MSFSVEIYSKFRIFITLAQVLTLILCLFIQLLVIHGPLVRKIARSCLIWRNVIFHKKESFVAEEGDHPEAPLWRHP